MKKPDHKQDIKKKDRTGFKETLRIHFKYLLAAAKVYPGIFTIVIPSKAVKAFSPFITIWLSAQIITELAGERRAEVLWNRVAVVLVVSVFLTVLNGILEHAKNVVTKQFYNYKNYELNHKMLSLDYPDVYKSETHDLYAQIMQSENWGLWGFANVYMEYQTFLEEIFSILGSILLTISLFTQKVPSSAGKLTLLDHPAVILFIFVFAMLLSYGCSDMAAKALADVIVKVDDDTRLRNRIVNHFGFLFATDEKRALDFRVYRQHIICGKQQEDAMKDFKIAEFAKGSWGVKDGLSYAIKGVLTFFIYSYVCLKALSGAFHIGSMIQYISALTLLFENLDLLIKNYSVLRSNTPYLVKIEQYLNIPNTMYQGSLTTEKRNDRKYEVEFRNVSFRYPESDTWVLKNINLKFKIGERLAIVGENGSGKTTFIKLMCRLYDPSEGQILLNGIDIRKYNYKEYMDIFSIVFQDFCLISQSLGSNVAGAEKYDSKRAEKALEDAGFKERLQSMEHGLETMLYKALSEDGIEISGGEAQKIAIARALYKDAPFIILDEPTAALDPITEAEIYSKFNDIVGDKTAIYISHRLSSCKFCDEIVVFSQGSIIQKGTHQQLAADTNGKYYELWQAQAQYYT